MTGQDFALFFTADDRAKGVPAALLRHAAADGRYHHEGWRVRRDGTAFRAAATLYRLPDALGGTAGFLEIIRDCTQEPALLEEKEALIARLMASNAELERFAFIASHDLQEPLRVVSSFSLLTLRQYGGRLDDAGRQYLDHIRDAAQRMQAMVNDLLDYARLGDESVRFTSFDAQEALELALRNLADSIAQSGAVITHEPLPVLHGIPGQFLRLMQNLLSNAIKFQKSGAQPRIHVGVQEQESAWLFTVRDNGIGIAPQYHEKIFESFRRLHTRREYDGSGLGLALCKKIIAHHAGTIWVQSAPDEGSSFCFSWPKQAGRREAAPGDTA